MAFRWDERNMSLTFGSIPTSTVQCMALNLDIHIFASTWSSTPLHKWWLSPNAYTGGDFHQMTSHYESFGMLTYWELLPLKNAWEPDFFIQQIPTNVRTAGVLQLSEGLVDGQCTWADGIMDLQTRAVSQRSKSWVCRVSLAMIMFSMSYHVSTMITRLTYSLVAIVIWY